MSVSLKLTAITNSAANTSRPIRIAAVVQAGRLAVSFMRIPLNYERAKCTRSTPIRGPSAHALSALSALSLFTQETAHDHEHAVRHARPRARSQNLSHQHARDAAGRHEVQLQSVPDRRRRTDAVPHGAAAAVPGRERGDPRGDAAGAAALRR